MFSTRLTLNSSKTQLIWFGTRQQFGKLDYTLYSNSSPYFIFLSSVRNLGMALDSTLTFPQHITSLTRSSYFQLRPFRAIRRSVSTPHRYLHCSCLRLFSDWLLQLLSSRSPKTRLSSFLSVLNTAVRLIARIPRYSHIKLVSLRNFTDFRSQLA